MDGLIQLGKIVAFILIDEKDISRMDVIEPVVNEKLFPARYGKIDLIAVVDMHVHGHLIIIEMGHRETLVFYTGLKCQFAGTKFYHTNLPSSQRGKACF